MKTPTGIFLSLGERKSDVCIEIMPACQETGILYKERGKDSPGSELFTQNSKDFELAIIQARIDRLELPNDFESLLLSQI